MKNIFLFGPSGFLGPSILKRFPSITAVGRTRPPIFIKNKFIRLKDFENLKVLDKIKIDYVIFLIGNSNHHVLNKSNLDLALGHNFYPLQKALNYFSKRKVKKFISFSGALLYDTKKIRIPCNEKTPLDPYRNNYLFSKFLAEEITKIYSNEIPIINIRLSNIYGPSILSRPDIILSIFEKIFFKKKVKIKSKIPIRDFIHVDDVADAVLKLCKSKFEGTINVGTGKGTSLKKVCSIIEKITDSKIYSDNIKVDGPMKYYHDVSLIKNVTSWRPKMKIEEGLQKTWEDIKKIKK